MPKLGEPLSKEELQSLTLLYVYVQSNLGKELCEESIGKYIRQYRSVYHSMEKVDGRMKDFLITKWKNTLETGWALKGFFYSSSSL